MKKNIVNKFLKLLEDEVDEKAINSVLSQTQDTGENEDIYHDLASSPEFTDILAELIKKIDEAMKTYSKKESEEKEENEEEEKEKETENEKSEETENKEDNEEEEEEEEEK